MKEYPERIAIEFTPECNMSCDMCPRQHISQKHGFMSKNLWEKLVIEILESCPKAIVMPFWRGESLLHPDFNNMIKFALERSVRIHISTNGTLVDEEKSKILAGCEFVTFSVHNAHGYKNAKKFLQFKNTTGPIVQISFVEGENSMKDMCSSLINSPTLDGFDSVRVYEMHTKDGVFGSSEHKPSINRVFCQKLMDTFVIAFDGSVSRCNHIWETEAGISVDNRSIRDIWKSDHFKHIRQKYPDGKCKPCGQWIGHTCGSLWKKENGAIRHSLFSPES